MPKPERESPTLKGKGGLLSKDKMVLRVEDLDNKDRDYVVVSMTPREDNAKADAGSPRTKLQQ